ncbi:hypothetical protein BC833DRAFT_592960 [Globomyces pollinis-pini]|nr:hypothetical protein BC833DRAFT_592960 [Globomyces pollinis-pini]
MSTLSILPLPGHDSFLNGYYGLEECVARGLIRIHYPLPITIQSLTITFRGMMENRFTHSVETLYRSKTLFEESYCLIDTLELEGVNNFIDIPFEIAIPGHDPITNGFGPCSQLLPPSTRVYGYKYGSTYMTNISYTLSASFTKPSSFPWIPSVIKKDITLSPFFVYDPRLIPLLLHPEERHWKSHVGAVPIEYDIVVGASVYGPDDQIRFGYRMLVNDDYARIQGVRISNVTFTLKETHIVGEDRCCVQDDYPNTWSHDRPSRIKGVTEILKWSQSEYSSLSRLSPQRKRTIIRRSDGEIATPADSDSSDLVEKAATLTIPEDRDVTGDGIYVEREVYIQLPGVGGFSPTTARPIIPSDDHICHQIRPRQAFLQVRHTISVTIDLFGADSICIEAGCYLFNIGKVECERLLEHEQDIVPTLDYNKVVGPLEVWVPEYQEKEDHGCTQKVYQPSVLKPVCNDGRLSRCSETMSNYSETPSYKSKVSALPNAIEPIVYLISNKHIISPKPHPNNSQVNPNDLDLDEDSTESESSSSSVSGEASLSRRESPPRLSPSILTNLPATPTPTYETSLFHSTSSNNNDPFLEPHRQLRQTSFNDLRDFELEQRIEEAMEETIF